jgi:hypothetical protein
MEESARETVIIVHGTWAAPEPGTRRWYQLADDGSAAEGFTAKLNDALQERDSPARCWAHCTQGNQIFQWSGDNSWTARTRAASALADYVARLRNDGWRCHIVVHSHGGNVVVEALPQIMAAPKSSGPPGTIVTLGTPFVDTKAPISRTRKHRLANINAVALILALILIPSLTLALYFEIIQKVIAVPILMWIISMIAVALYIRVTLGIPFEDMKSPISRTRKHRLAVVNAVALIPIASLTLALYFEYFKIIQNEIVNLIVIWFSVNATAYVRTRYHGAPSDSEAAGTQLPFLAIGSPMDEAWQILYHMRNINNPLAVRLNLISYVFSSSRSLVLQTAEVEHILGAKSFREMSVAGKWKVIGLLIGASSLLWVVVLSHDAEFALLLSGGMTIGFLFNWYAMADWYFSDAYLPFRWCARLIAALASVPNEVAIYVVRRKGWSVLLAMAMGLEGYRFELPDIEQRPSHASGQFIKYEDMPKGAEQRALTARSAWISCHFGDVSQTFSKMMVTPADITSLLRTIEADQSLVHGAYYTDDECIGRIADWISGKE